MANANDDGLRIDKWLWFARFFKTRGQATEAVRGGHIRLNRERPKPGARVHPGDRMTIMRGQLKWVVTVTSLPVRRGPARDARACYDEDAESRDRRDAMQARLRSDRLQMPMTDGRPDKRTRRAIRDRGRRSDR